MLIRLEQWAERNLDPSPSLQTLRAWARTGKILGARKLGRAYYVPEDADVIDDAGVEQAYADPVIGGILNGAKPS